MQESTLLYMGFIENVTQFCFSLHKKTFLFFIVPVCLGYFCCYVWKIIVVLQISTKSFFQNKGSVKCKYKIFIYRHLRTTKDIYSPDNLRTLPQLVALNSLSTTVHRHKARELSLMICARINAYLLSAFYKQRSRYLLFLFFYNLIQILL